MRPGELLMMKVDARRKCVLNWSRRSVNTDARNYTAGSETVALYKHRLPVTHYWLLTSLHQMFMAGKIMGVKWSPNKLLLIMNRTRNLHFPCIYSIFRIKYIWIKFTCLYVFLIYRVLLHVQTIRYPLGWTMKYNYIQIIYICQVGWRVSESCVVAVLNMLWDPQYLGISSKLFTGMARLYRNEVKMKFSQCTPCWLMGEQTYACTHSPPRHFHGSGSSASHQVDFTRGERASQYGSSVETRYRVPVAL
jgi:hypothetical protein